MVPAQPPSGMSSKSGSGTPGLTRTRSPGLYRGNRIGLSEYAIGKLTAGTIVRPGPVLGIRPTTQLSPIKFRASNDVVRASGAGRLNPRKSRNEPEIDAADATRLLAELELE